MAKGPQNNESEKQHAYNYDGGYRSNGRYGTYGYSDTAYGYEGEGRNERGIGDYIAMFRERIWWLFITLFVSIVFMGFYCINATPEYAAFARLQILRQQDRTMEFSEITDATIRNDVDLNTEITILEGDSVVRGVERRLKESEWRQLLEPYKGQRQGDGQALTPATILAENRRILPKRNTMMVVISFTHPNRELAARVANLFAEEYISIKRQQSVATTMRAVDELREQLAAQGRKVRELEIQMANLKETYSTISFDAETDINQQELMRLTDYATQDRRILDDAEAVWHLVEQAIQGGRDLWEIPAVKGDPRIPDLLRKRTEANIEVAGLSQIYRDKHPRMIDARRRLQQINDELNQAVSSTVEGIRNTLENARRNYESTKANIVQKQAERIQLEKIRPDYERLRRDLEGARNHYDYLYARQQQTLAMSSDENESARVMDVAFPPIKPSSPKVVLNMFLAVFLGTSLGVGIIVLFVVLDDRVKSSFDIESSLGLNIVGIIPRIPKSLPQSRARISSKGDHQPTVEAFRSIHSSLMLGDEARNAKVILVTSTIPSEGKSFVTTNIALTFASHGERVIVLDGDLRMPNVAKSLDLSNSKGLLTVLSGKDKLDDVIQRSVDNNFDVLPTGGSTGNPTQILCSSKFEEVLHELRLRYDRVFIDSPPLAPVSDALNLVSNTDGVIYVIRFNTVKRKTAGACLRRLREAGVPLLGAVMNNISITQTTYYYSHYYDRSYNSYYVGHRSHEQNPETAKAASNGTMNQGK